MTLYDVLYQQIRRKMNKKNEIAVRLILPSGVKEIQGEPEFVIEEIARLSSLESDIGKSFAEKIPVKHHQEQINFEENYDNTKH